jgi:hypothetical protein
LGTENVLVGKDTSDFSINYGVTPKYDIIEEIDAQLSLQGEQRSDVRSFGGSLRFNYKF